VKNDECLVQDRGLLGEAAVHGDKADAEC